jgi:threonine/homoserine/homoserine lactone efflux protein
VAFNVVKFAGAAYLLLLAWKTIREHREIELRGNGRELSGFALFKRGFIMNVLNPKVALFFVAAQITTGLAWALVPAMPYNPRES